MDSEDKLKKNVPSVLDQWKSRKKKAGVPKGISPMPDGVTAIPSLGQQRL